jgi:membrane-associated protease RseP (regulator of RpoE activity)
MTVIAKQSGAATPPPSSPDDDGLPSDPPPPVTSGNVAQVTRLVVVLALVTAIFLVAGLGDLLLFIAILIVIVMLHELGHFATAKWSGMKVTEFFVGFGPRLWSVRRGETEYGVKAIPAGGYVRITGFTMLEEVAEEDEARAYRQQAFWKRIVVASAGSIMHFIIAFVLLLIIVFSYGVPSNNETIASVDHWSGVAQTPAQAAGLTAGDTIVSINGKNLTSPTSLTNVIGRSVGKTVTLGVEVNGKLRHISAVPISGKGIVVNRQHLADHGYLGVELVGATASEGPLHAIGTAVSQLGSDTSQEVSGVWRTFSPSGLSSVVHQVTNSHAATKAADNPSSSVRPVSLVGIASLGVQAQQAGLVNLLELLVLINIIFGLLNMLPMIPLDGGHVAVAAYEWIRTRRGKAFYRADITKLFPVVFIFLAFLAVFVLSGVYLDLTHPLKNIFGP